MAKHLLLQVVIEPDEDVFTAYCPALPGCITWGKTYEETYQHIQEAILCYLEGLEKLKKNKYAVLLGSKSKKKYVKELKQPSVAVSLKDAS
jgi:predicted RNase H-like HicB family nuclease